MNTIMKKYLFYLAALVLGLTACDNYFDATYLDNADPQKTVIEKYDYTLSADEYKTIANNSVNKKYAADLDSVEGKDIYAKALEQVGKDKCFNENATADMYVPAFIYSKYPQLDPTSTFNVTYLFYEGTPEYLEFFTTIEHYELKAADYKAVWGSDDVKFLTPATEKQLVNFLPQVDDDNLLGVRYAYSSKEPADGGVAECVKEVLYIYKDGLVWQPYTSKEYTILIQPDEISGQVEKWLANSFPYAVKDDQVVVLQYDSKAKKYAATEYNFDGLLWIANTGVIEETMSFVLSQGWQANLSTYYKQAVAGDGNMGKITLHHYDLEEGITYIWAFDNLYGMKGTAYKSGAHYGEGWFVLPAIKLKNSTAPALSFDMAMNYGPVPEDGRYEQASVWVSTDYVDDAHAATWTQLPWNMFNEETNTGFPDANSWTFYNSGRMDLSPWNNQTIYIGFRYKSEPGQTCSTWEVKNILVNEPEQAE